MQPRRVRAPQNSAADSYRCQQDMLAGIESVYKRVIPTRSAISASHSYQPRHLSFRRFQTAQTRCSLVESIRGVWDEVPQTDNGVDEMVIKSMGSAQQQNRRSRENGSRPGSRDSILSMKSIESFATVNSLTSSLNSRRSSSRQTTTISPQSLRYVQEKLATEKARLLRLTTTANQHRYDRGYLVCGTKYQPSFRQSQAVSAIRSQTNQQSSAIEDATVLNKCAPNRFYRRHVYKLPHSQKETVSSDTDYKSITVVISNPSLQNPETSIDTQSQKSNDEENSDAGASINVASVPVDSSSDSGIASPPHIRIDTREEQTKSPGIEIDPMQIKRDQQNNISECNHVQNLIAENRSKSTGQGASSCAANHSLILDSASGIDKESLPRVNEGDQIQDCATDSNTENQTIQQLPENLNSVEEYTSLKDVRPGLTKRVTFSPSLTETFDVVDDNTARTDTEDSETRAFSTSL